MSLWADGRRGRDGYVPLRRLFSVELRIDDWNEFGYLVRVPNVNLDTLWFGRDQWLRGRPAHLS